MMTSTAVPPQREEDIDLLRYGRFLASYWKLIGAMGVAGAVAGAVIAWRAPVRYEASVTLTVAQPTTATPLALTPATSRALLANLTLVSETLHEAGIDGSPQAFVAQALTIQPIPTTSLLRLIVSLPDPTKARLAADILSRKAIALSTRLDQTGAMAARDALKAQSDEAARRFAEAEQSLSALEGRAASDRRAGAALLLFQGHDDLAKAAVELETEKARLAVLEREAGASGSRGDTSNVGASATIANSAQRPAVNLPLAYALRYEAAQSRARIAELEHQHARDDTPAASAGQAGDLYRLKAEYERRRTDYDITKRVYMDLAGKYTEAAGRVAANSPQLLLVDPAVQPDRPEARQMGRSAMLGAILGLLAGLAAAIVANRRSALAIGG